jgi:hypothetical protein
MNLRRIDQVGVVGQLTPLVNTHDNVWFDRLVGAPKPFFVVFRQRATYCVGSDPKDRSLVSVDQDDRLCLETSTKYTASFLNVEVVRMTTTVKSSSTRLLMMTISTLLPPTSGFTDVLQILRTSDRDWIVGSH